MSHSQTFPACVCHIPRPSPPVCVTYTCMHASCVYFRQGVVGKATVWLCYHVAKPRSLSPFHTFSRGETAMEWRLEMSSCTIVTVCLVPGWVITCNLCDGPAQVVYRGPVKKSGLPVPSPLSAHSHSAHSLKSATPTSSGTCICILFHKTHE